MQTSLAVSTGEPTATSANTTAQKQIPRKWLAYADMFVGVLFIVGVPAAFYSYSVINYNDIAVGVVFGLIILLASVWDYMGAKNNRRSVAPYVILLLGIISIFLFSYTFDTPWVKTYHLYIVPIDFGGSSNPFYIPASHGEYHVQNYLSSISTMGGLILLISSIYEVTLVRKLPRN
ncbi:MAG: hypothetical protein JRN68_01550 [Nitrososphaerota archaeon]|jgi:hypothetical protein|nr:hypothetical protein [Nitrososphaerota archaeon]